MRPRHAGALRIHLALLAGLLAQAAAGAEEPSSVRTRPGEEIIGVNLVLSGGELWIEAAGGKVRRFKASEVEAFAVFGKRTLVTTEGHTLKIARAALADGEVTFSSTLGELAVPLERVKSVEYDGWKAHYARLTGGFIDRAGKAVEQQPFRMNLAIGYVATSGTSDTSSLSVSLDGSTVRGPWKLSMSGRALVAESEGVKTSDLKEAGLKLDRYFNPLTYGYARTAAFRDTITDVRLRLNAGAGAGRKLLARPRHELTGELGLEYQYERTEPGGLEEVDEGGVWRGALSYAWKINPRATFTQEGEVVWGLDSDQDMRSKTLTALSAKVAENMMMKFCLTWDYDDGPPAGNEHSEFRFETAIVISF